MIKTLQLKSTKILCAAFFAFTGLSAFAQSPGGVSTNLTLWLKADYATSIVGSSVQTWTTSGGSAIGYNVTQPTAANRPTLISGATNTSKYNYNPSIKFTSGSSTRLFKTGGTPDLLGNNGTAIIVTSQAGISGFTYYSGTTGRYQLKSDFRFQTGNSGTGYTFDWKAPTEYSTSSATMIASYGCASTAALRKNSVQETTPNNTAALYNPSVSAGLFLGANSTSEYANNSIAEVILFNSKPTIAEMDRIESYLAIKYGITRGGNTNITATYNYIASNGTTILWNKTANTGYNNDIAAIGRDDSSGLNQKQSISVNNGEAVTISLGNGAIPTENITNSNTFSSTSSFLAWGNNGSTKDFSKTTTKPTGILERLNRVWKTQATNFNQQTTFGFDTSQITGLGTPGSLCLLFDDDGDFSNATVVSSCLSTNPTGSRIEFAGITIPAGKPYFTLARVIVPTQITNNGNCIGAALNLTTQTVGSSTTYSWTGPNGFTSTDQNPTIPAVTSAMAGTYTAVITTYGCTTTLKTTLVVNPMPTVTIDNPVTCEGTPTIITATPGVVGTYTYSWTVPSGATNPGDVASFSPTTAGIYSVTITDTKTSCVSKSASGTVTINPLPTVTVDNPITCAGTPTTITATPDVTGSYTYVWTVPSGATNPGNVSGFSTGIAGTYSVVITDNTTLCVSKSASGTVTVNPFPMVTVNSPATCEGTPTTITATTSVTGNYSYAWTVPSGATDPGDVASFSTSTAGTYSVVITETTGSCVSESISGIVTVNPLPTPTLNDGTVCIDATTGKIVNGAELDAELSGSQYQYTWYLEPNTTPIGGANSSKYTAMKAGDYTVKVLNTSTGCYGTDTSTVMLSNPAESATAVASNYFEENQIITVTVVGDASYLYSLDGGDFQSSNVFEYVSSGSHTVTIHDTLGCTDITIKDIMTMNYPHFFTPNGDGNNDTWNIPWLKYNQPNSIIYIFDRYGKLVKQITHSSESWDGTYNDQPLPSSDYWFTVEFKENGVDKTFKAHFSLKR